MSGSKISSKNPGFIFPAAASVLLLLIMGFIDDKKYSFAFLLDRGSLITLGIYLLALLVSQALFYFLFLRHLRPVNRALYSFILGIPLAIIFLALCVLLLVN